MVERTVNEGTLVHAIAVLADRARARAKESTRTILMMMNEYLNNQCSQDFFLSCLMSGG